MSKSTSTESKRYCEIRCKSLEDTQEVEKMLKDVE